MEGLIPKIEELTANLKHQITLHRQLTDLLREEKEHLLAVRFKEIREATYAKEAILDEVRREEFRRQAWTSEAAKAIGISPQEITMEIVANKIAPEQFESLMSLKNTLLVLIKKTRDMNNDNKRLVEAAIKDTNEMKRNLLGISSGQPQTYGPKGNIGAVRDQSARFLSKEA
jgi:flagellar biosynthesis/type III secretory pathway chaperone